MWKSTGIPTIALEMLSNLACALPLIGEEQKNAIWPLMKGHFDRLLKTKDDDALEERVIVM